MLSIYSKEIRSFFNSLIGYIVIVLFLLASGLKLWVFSDTVLDYGEASLVIFFDFAPYIFWFLIPAITMRTFAEEKKGGTMELLLSRPITELQLLLGKYFACLTLVVIALLPTIIYYISLYSLGEIQGNIDTAATIGSYIGLLLLAAAYTAVGVFASSITENQIVSFILAIFLSFVMFESFIHISALLGWSSFSYVVERFGFAHHYNALSRGVIDLRNVIYFLGFTAIVLAGTRLILLSRKW